MGDWDLRRPTAIYKIGTNGSRCAAQELYSGICSDRNGKEIQKKKKKSIYVFVWASLKAQLEKNLPAMQETLVRFLGWEVLLEKG